MRRNRAPFSPGLNTAFTTAFTPAAAFTLTLATACGPDTPAPAGDFATTVDTIGGTVHVTNTGTPPPARLELVASIGPKSLTDTGSPDEFGGVNSVALGPDGEVFVADARNFEVRVFGPDGAHLRTFGRQGEGPGEFRSLYSLAWAGDRLLTYDPVQGRIGEWSAEGQWLGQQGTESGYTGPVSSVRLYPVGPDEVLRPGLGATFESEFGRAFKSVLIGLNSRGETGDTLARLDGPPGGPPSGIVCQSEQMISFFTIPFAPQFVQHPGPGGITYSAHTSAYRIAVTRHDGADTLRVIERSLPAESIGDDEWQAGNQEYQDWRAEMRGASCEPSGPTRPATKPFIEDLFVAPDGRLWVEVMRTAGNRWEVFDTEGRLLVSFPAPARGERVVPAFDTSGHLLTIRQDSLDLDHVDVWRLSPPPRSSPS